MYHAKRGSLVSLEQCLSNSDISLSTRNIYFMCKWLAYSVDAYHEDNQSVGSLIVSEPALNVIYINYLNLIKVISSIHSVNIDNNVMLRRNSTSQLSISPSLGGFSRIGGYLNHYEVRFNARNPM